MESSREWAARIKAEEAAKTPEQRAVDEAEVQRWLASLPALPPLPLQPGQVQVIFYNRRPKREG